MKIPVTDLTCESGTCEFVSHVNTREPHVNHMRITCEIKLHVKLEHEKNMKM